MTMTPAERTRKWRTTHPEIVKQRIKCKMEGCPNFTSSDRKNPKKGRSGLCMRCAKRGRPFGPAYTRVRYMARRGKLKCLSYEEYLSLTTFDQCHYCHSQIPWTPHFIEGESGAQSYFLDKKDALKGYTLDNVVVCCTFCNFVKSNRFTYEEFMLLSPVLTQIAQDRLTSNI